MFRYCYVPCKSQTTESLMNGTSLVQRRGKCNIYLSRDLITVSVYPSSNCICRWNWMMKQYREGQRERESRIWWDFQFRMAGNGNGQRFYFSISSSFDFSYRINQNLSSQSLQSKKEVERGTCYTRKCKNRMERSPNAHLMKLQASSSHESCVIVFSSTTAPNTIQFPGCDRR